MSREVRRVPVGWQHPVEPNPHWEYQTALSRRLGRDKPASRLHGPTERFVPLFTDYPGCLAEWEREGQEIAERRGRHWTFQVEWHLTGIDDCTCHPGQTGVTHPHYGWSEDGETEIPVEVRDEGHLHQLTMTQHASEKPDPADYMPVFDQPEDTLGWCLYETVSEGTPATPVFATAEELIDHLATVGQDWDQVPMRREAAETLVCRGSSLGSFATVGGRLYRSDMDADRLADALTGGGA